VREHRIGATAWIVGGALAMLFMGLALNEEMASFPGGPQALALSVTPAAEAMRVLRWPAEHLETLGGYLTFHNVMLVSGFLSLYAALQGARLVRGPEEGHSLEDVLATGWSRTAYLRDRAAGFVIVLSAITVGIAVGIAWALAASDSPDLAGSLVTMAAVGLGCLVAFALGVLLSQVTRSSRSARGISALVLVAMYLANNAVDAGDPLGWIRYLTAFHWVNQSRALVPGYGADLGAMGLLLVVALVLLGLAAVAFQHRDYGAGLWSRSARSADAPVRHVTVQHWWLRSPWLASLREHRIGLAAWVAASGAFAALMMLLQPAAIDVFEQFSYYLGMVGGVGTTPEVMYSTFITDVIAPIVAAYVITQAAGWVADLEQGRVETLLSAPLSWTRLVWERLLAVGAGVVVITGVCLAVIGVGSVVVGAEVSVAALGRVGVTCALLAWAGGALATIAVVALRSALALTVVAVYVAFAYLLTWMIPMFDWPTWTERLSIFAAFGHPYREWPGVGSLVLLGVLAVIGSVVGAVIAERTPKVG
jgi:ABC-2 type transport system permease protein